jgi:lipid-A-disaccharide synthase
MKYYLIAGEASGDLHASNLMKQIQLMDSDAEFRFWGGNKMQEVADQKPIKHYKDMAFMGFIEVAANIKTIKRNLDFCKKDILEYQPDALILIDYPGFNLRIAEFAHSKNIKVAYYISPQIWAWKESRISKIKRDIDLMLVILPFEEAYFEKHNFKVHFVGHPLLDHMEREEKQSRLTAETLAILPGSRAQEIEKMLPIMLEAAKNIEIKNVIIAATSNLPIELYNKHIHNQSIKIVFDNMHEVLRESDLALVTSGTATLETALLNIPQVVCYKTSNISYQIAKKLVKVKYISLVNLIINKLVVRELIQNDMNPKELTLALKRIFPGEADHVELLKNYQLLPQKLGGKGASERAARLIINLLKN